MMTGVEMVNQKASLRQKLLRSRLCLTPSIWQAKSQQLSQHLLNAKKVQEAQTILAYFSFRQEPDLSFLFTQSQAIFGFPRCVDQSLFWHPWQPGEPRRKGRFGILEPHPDSRQLEAEEVDLILVPAVGCDRQGYRLGYGGGFYDRMLETPRWQKIPTLGIIFDFAYVDQLPIDPWDYALDGVCTETGLKECSNNSD
jgi:5-formyltetrahydrofolate cyclo-ligase